MTKSSHLGLRLLCVILCAVCVLCMAHPLAASAAEDEKQQSLTTLVRYRAYFSAAVIGQLEDGTQITVLGESRDFYKVDCYDMKGYIAKSQVVHKEDGNYYIRCQEGSSETGVLTYTDHAEALALRHSLFELAKKQLGSRYVYGSSRPGRFDCSGLTYYLYGQHGINIYRSASTQLQDGIIVSKEGLQVGDLVFFREAGSGALASHVGIYVGNNQMIHSASKGVQYTDLDFEYYAKYYLCARRIINTSTAEAQDTAVAAVPAAAPVVTGRRTR